MKVVRLVGINLKLLKIWVTTGDNGWEGVNCSGRLKRLFSGGA